MLVWFGFVTMMNDQWAFHPDLQLVTYYVGLFFIGGLYGNMIFSALSRKRESIQFLLLPASHLEKLLCGLFFSVVLFFITYTLLFYVVDIPMAHLARSIHIARLERFGRMVGQSPEVNIFNLFAVKDGPAPDFFPPLLLMIYLSIQAFVLLGSIYFTRYAILKSLLSAIGIVILSVLFLSKVIFPLVPDGWRMSGLTSWSLFSPSEIKFVRLPLWVGHWSYQLLQYGLPLIFWVTAWFRLKEKEV